LIHFYKRIFDKSDQDGCNPKEDAVYEG